MKPHCYFILITVVTCHNGNCNTLTWCINGSSLSVIPMERPFTGTVSLENQRWFCAVKYTFDRLSLQDAKSFSVRLKGDGKVYQFRGK
jgi:hypothetical protein